MKRYFLLFCTAIAIFSSFAQHKTFSLEDYKWLNESHSEENLKWVEARKKESLDYLNSIKLLSELENWNKEFRQKHDWKKLRFEMAANQIGSYGEKIMGNIWARAPLEQLLAKTARPTMVNINTLNLPLKGDLLFDHIVSYPLNYDNCLAFYKQKGRRILKALVEYNWATQEVVENGFKLPPAHTDVQWRDENSIYVNTNLENPDEFGYKLRVWKRGEPIEQAKVIFETKHYKAGLMLLEKSGHLFVVEQKKAFDEVYYYLKNDKLTLLNLPNDVAQMTFVSGEFVVRLRSAWKPSNTRFPAGSLISINFNKFINGDNNFTLIAESTRERVIDQIWNTDNILIARILEDVQSVLYEWTLQEGQWKSKRLDNPIGGNLSVLEIQSKVNRYYIKYRYFLEGANYVRNEDGSIIKYSEYKAFNNKEDFEIKQHFATSKDGTQVPYFMIYKKGLEFNNNNPVIMTGYGGWGRSILDYWLTPYMRWLEDGGIFVSTNIRGGGEYGPDWHESARKSNRQNAYDDFLAVAEDLINKQISKAGIIGSFGGSNGGLLVANGFIQNPDIFGAVVIRSGSIDLELNGTGGGRGIGALGERGDPEIPEEWDYMKKISPLHTIEANKKYPHVLQLTSRNDDVSDPVKSRKFHQRMLDLGYKDVYLIETAGGTHGATDLPNDKELELAFFYKNIHPNYKNLIKN